MEVWFRSFSFLKTGDGCRFQPLIFQGVSINNGGEMVVVSWFVIPKLAEAR